jgi:hypothetical protein
MATFRSGPSSGIPSISDLDGYTLRDYQFPPTSYPPSNDDNFGFDPPSAKPSTMTMYQTYSPPNDLSMSGWPEFEREGDIKETVEPPMDLDAFDVDKFISSTLPNSGTAVARFGQMTPPRSSSAVSSHFRDKAMSPKTAPERKKSKAQAKPTEGAAKPGRKRKSTRKASIASDISEPLEGSKRKQSLEKNRLAAAKCRINKKEKTEQLQRDSHDKAVQNSYLKDQVMRMKDEVQQMNAILLAHANCEGCRSPEGLQAHLSQLGSDFFNHQHMDNGVPSFLEYPQMDYSPLTAVQDSFFPSTTRGSMVNPPLPEFNRGAEFEVHTPHGD